jgi:hypothetical protein
MLTRSPGVLVMLILAERPAEASFKLLVQLYAAMQLRAAIHEYVSIIATFESGRFFLLSLDPFRWRVFLVPYWRQLLYIHLTIEPERCLFHVADLIRAAFDDSAERL